MKRQETIQKLYSLMGKVDGHQMSIFHADFFGVGITTGINVSGVLPDETGLDKAAVFQHGSYSTALAYGSQTTHMVFKSMHVTAAATTATWIFGDVNRITTSAASIGYIDVGYNYLSIGHDLVNGFASRNRAVVTAACELGETCGLLATMEIGAHAITAEGTATLSAAIFDTDITSGATVAQEVTCLEVRPHIRANIDGISCAIRVNVNCSTPNYLDYGIDIRSISANQTAAMRILMTGASAALPAGIIIEGKTSDSATVTSAVKIDGTVTTFLEVGDASAVVNFAMFNELSGCIAATDVDPGDEPSDGGLGADGSIVIDVNGTAYYIPIFDSLKS